MFRMIFLNFIVFFFKKSKFRFKHIYASILLSIFFPFHLISFGKCLGFNNYLFFNDFLFFNNLLFYSILFILPENLYMTFDILVDGYELIFNKLIN